MDVFEIAFFEKMSFHVKNKGNCTYSLLTNNKIHTFMLVSKKETKKCDK